MAIVVKHFTNVPTVIKNLKEEDALSYCLANCQEVEDLDHNGLSFECLRVQENGKISYEFLELI